MLNLHYATLTKNMVLVAIIVMDLLTGMEFDLFVPSFPELQHHFALSPFWVEATLSANFLGYCLGLFFVGELADHYGRKPIILFGLIIFILGSIFCLFIPSYAFFLIGRILQGLGVAAPSILSFLIIADAYPLKKQYALMGILNGLMNVAAASAPVIGSYITLYFHWQGNFITLLALGLLALTMTICFIPYTLPQHKQKFIPLSFSGYVPIFQSKPLMLLIINLLFMFIPYWIFVGMSPLLYMKDLGVSLSHFGYYQGILALVFAFGSIFYGLVMVQYNQKNMLYITMQIFIFSLIIIGSITFSNSTNPLFITLAFLPFVIGQIIPSIILYPICLNFMPETKARISALIQGFRLILSAIFLQIAGYFYDKSFQNIGIILLSLIFIAVVTLFCVLKNRELMKVL